MIDSYILKLFLFIFIFYKQIKGYEVTLQDSDTFFSSFYLCQRNSIAYSSDSNSTHTHFYLLKYNDEYDDYNIITDQWYEIQFPMNNGIVQTNGQKSCFLYFVQPNKSRELVAFSLNFQDLKLTQSSNPQPISMAYTDQFNIIQQEDDDQEAKSKQRIFFLKNTNLYFIDTNNNDLVWNSNLLNLQINTVSRNIFAGISDKKEQKLFTFTLDKNVIQPTEISLTLPQAIYSDIQSIMVANILEWSNYLENKPYTISLYASSVKLPSEIIYWILQIFEGQIQKVLYKLPNYYSVMMNYNGIFDNRKCLSFLNDKNKNRYIVLCPKYVLIDGYKSTSSNRYSLFINNGNITLFIQYSEYNKNYINLYKNNDKNTLIKTIVEDVECISNPMFISFAKNTLSQLFCKQYGSYYTTLVASKSIVLGKSQLYMKILTNLFIATFCVVLLGTLITYFSKRRKITDIYNKFKYLTVEKKRFQLNEEQFNEKYQILQESSLGRGTFGSVFVCIEKPNKIALAYNKKLKEQKRAVKQIMFRQENKRSEIEEVMLLRMLQSYESIIRLINYHESHKILYIVLELAQSSLEQQIEERVKEKKHYTQEEILSFCKQIGFLMRELHCNKAITHRDLKPQNILVVNGLYKLSDFGAARALNLEDFYRQNTHVGSLKWMSPEMHDGVLQNNLITKYKLNYYKCDVFSLGLILMRMITLENISGINQSEERKNFCVSKMYGKRREIDADLLKVVEDMLQYDLKQRIEMSTFKVRIEDIIKNQSEQTQRLEENQKFNQNINEDDPFVQYEEQHIVTGGSSIKNVPVGGENSSINTVNIFKKKLE